MPLSSLILPRRLCFGKDCSPRYRAFTTVLKQWIACAVLLGAVSSTAPALSADAPRLLILGDSLTAGYGLAQEQAFPVRLEAALRDRGIAVSVINSGVSGDTTAGGRARLDWALADRPTHAIVELGANDALRGVDPRVTRDNLDRIVATLKSAGVSVMLAGMYAPPNWGREYAESFRDIYPDLAREHDVALYPFFLDGVAADPALNQDDGIHPNEKGVSLIVERILPHVVRFLTDKE
ncbi:MAG: arylesterase [Rhodospirillaceae bacterium]